MDGYLAQSATDISGRTIESILYCKTNIGGYFFDGFMSEELASELEITSNPVETGASIVDHAYVKPSTVTMEIIMSDVHASLIPGQFTGGWSRSVTAYKILKQIQSNRVPVAVLTRLGLYENMLISSIVAHEDANTYRALSATVQLVEIPVARVRTVEISAASQTTIQTEMGKIQAVEVSSTERVSILRQLAESLGYTVEES